MTSRQVGFSMYLKIMYNISININIRTDCRKRMPIAMKKFERKKKWKFHNTNCTVVSVHFYSKHTHTVTQKNNRMGLTFFIYFDILVISQLQEYPTEISARKWSVLQSPNLILLKLQEQAYLCKFPPPPLHLLFTTKNHKLVRQIKVQFKPTEIY